MKKHPNKEIREALAYAIQQGWTVKESNARSHSWGKMYCPNPSHECRCGEFCIASIWSTQKNPSNHAKQIKRIVNNCIYLNQEKLGDN